jgi:hypothetical protein
VRVFGVRRADDGLRLARQHRPQVIVWDVDAQAHDPNAVADGFERAAWQDDVALVVIGSGRTFATSGHYVRKPFQFAPLVRQIEELLAQRTFNLARAA